MLGALFAVALVAGQAPPADDPVAKAPEGAAFVFAQVCLLRLNVAQTPVAYAAGSDELGRGVLNDTPALRGVLAIDGADGRGCRVRYTGPRADAAWATFSASYRKMVGDAPAVCTARPSTSGDTLRAACVSQGEAGDPRSVTRHATLEIERSTAAVTARLIDIRP